MKVTDACKKYFRGFQEIFNFRKNDKKINGLAVLKILSYVSVVIPVGVATVYGAFALYGRVRKKEDYTFSETTTHDQAKKILELDSKDNSETRLSKLEPTDPITESSKEVTFSTVLSAYDNHFRPKANLKNLQSYSNSEDYQRHAKTARIYYNANQLAEKDALRIVYQREPTNIAMGEGQYNKKRLMELFNYEKGVFIEKDSKKEDGSLFKELPNSVTIYSETYIWSPPGGENKKEVACLSLPAPALDSIDQPHYIYYMEPGKLDEKKYTDEMRFLFQCIEKAVMDNKDTAFDGKGIKRLVLSRFGQGAFLEALNKEDRTIAQKCYKAQMANFLDRIKDTNLKVFMSEYSDPKNDVWLDQMIIGDILKTSEEGDLIINAWDPHSAPGNGNDADKSFDGAMGKGSGILLTQTSWLNKTLKDPASLVAVQ